MPTPPFSITAPCFRSPAALVLFEPTASGEHRFDIEGAPGTSPIVVAQGAGCQWMGCTFPGETSLRLSLSAGDPVALIVGTSSTTGPFALRVSPPTCLGHPATTSLVDRAEGTTAESMVGVLNSCITSPVDTVTFTAPETGVFVFSTDRDASSFDAVVEALDGDSCESLGCSGDDALSRLIVPLEAGDEVLLVVGGRDGRTGDWAIRAEIGNFANATAQRLALESIYWTLGGPAWFLESPWLTEAPPCEWARVECDDSWHITGLRLSSLGASGTLTPGLFDGFPRLSYLSLARNLGITGPIPADLPGSLETLELASTGLSGPMDAVFSLTNLTRLYLGSGPLTGTIPASLVHMTSLFDLWIERAPGVTGRIPTKLPESLSILILPELSLTGSIPPTLPRALFFLDLSSNLLTGGLEGLAEMPVLSTLYVGHNAITGTLDPLANLTLFTLDVPDNLLGGAPADVLDPMTLGFRASINLDANMFEGRLPSSQATVNAVYSNNAFTGTIPPLPDTIEVYSIGNNLVSGQHPGVPESGWNEVRFWDLSSNVLTGSLPVHIGALGMAPRENGLPHEVLLNGNALSGILPVSLSNSPVARIDLRDNHITGFPAEWAMVNSSPSPLDYRFPGVDDQFLHLTELLLDTNPISNTTSELLQTFKTLPKLELLSCQECSLRGDLDEFGRPYYLRTGPEGTLSTERFAFFHLSWLRLAENPDIVGRLSSLPASVEAASLSGTGLSGDIPDSWLRLFVLELRGTNITASGEQWMSFATLSETRVLSPTYGCFELRSTRSRLLDVDASYVGYSVCECNAGFAGAPPNCLACAGDSYRSSEQPQGECVACPAFAHTAPGVTAASSPDQCLCEAGYRKRPGTQVCEACPPGEFASQAGLAECSACGPGTHSDVGSFECFQCPPRGVDCVGGANGLLPAPGFWRDPPTAPISADTTLYPCVPADVCRINGDGEVVCGPGHAGVLCAECSNGYAKFEGRCQPCWSQPVSWVLVVLSTSMFVAVLFVLVRAAQRGVSRASVAFKILSNHIQNTLILGALAWPGPLLLGETAAILSAGTGADLSAGLLWPVQCIGGVDYNLGQGLTLLLPLVAIAVVWTCAAAGALSRPMGVSATVIIASQTHAMVLRRTMAFFRCTTVSGVSLHADDLGTPCSGSTYDAMLAVHALSMVFMVLAVPIVGLYIVHQLSVTGKLGSGSAQRRFGFLYLGYKSPGAGRVAPGVDLPAAAGASGAPTTLLPTQYFEAVLILRKIVLTLCVTFMGPLASGRTRDPEDAAADQSAVVILVLAVALLVQATVQPFVAGPSPGLNVVEVASILTLMTTVASGIARGDSRGVLVAMSMLGHVAVVSCCLWTVAHVIWRRVRGTIKRSA